MASQKTSSLISKIYKSRRVILDLMEKQSYNISEYKGFSVNEVNTMTTNNQLDMILEKVEASDSDVSENNNKKIYIKYYLAKALRPSNLQEMIDDLFNLEEILKKDDTLFIIIKDEINTIINNNNTIVDEKKCNKCNKIFSSKQYLNKHLLICKGVSNPLECHLCHNILANSSSKSRH